MNIQMPTLASRKKQCLHSYSRAKHNRVMLHLIVAGIDWRLSWPRMTTSTKRSCAIMIDKELERGS